MKLWQKKTPIEIPDFRVKSLMSNCALLPAQFVSVRKMLRAWCSRSTESLMIVPLILEYVIKC